MRRALYIRLLLVIACIWLVSFVLLSFTRTKVADDDGSFRPSQTVINLRGPQKHSEFHGSELLSALINGAVFDSKGAGEMGKSFSLNRDESTEEKRRFKENEFNVVVSEHISLNRSLPYVAPAQCKKLVYPEGLPKTSVVIVFHNEAWSTLLRTVHSIINRSPRHLLEEIILIDDASDQNHLKKPLEDYLKRFNDFVKLHRLLERSGLIVARVVGAKMATGQVLTFLDAHVEATEGWLEPLLMRIHEDRTRLLAPVIDIISESDFKYVNTAGGTWGGFTWQLSFRWYTNKLALSKKQNNDMVSSPVQPLQTPTIAGGLFSIDKGYFFEIGAYDEGMKIWGSENVEISIRIWTCGGSMEIHPCSHVGHVFRKQTPYRFVGDVSDVIHGNGKRVADIWLDSYRDFYYAATPMARKVDVGDMTSRIKLRASLGCKSFRWYLENIYPECSIPITYYSLGRIVNDDTNLCLDAPSKQSGKAPLLQACHSFGGNQAWSYTGSSELRSDEHCLLADSSGLLSMEKCLNNPSGNSWRYEQTTKTLVNVANELCLTGSKKKVQMKDCTADDPSQMWTLDTYDGMLYPRDDVHS